MVIAADWAWPSASQQSTPPTQAGEPPALVDPGPRHGCLPAAALLYSSRSRQNPQNWRSGSSVRRRPSSHAGTRITPGRTRSQIVPEMIYYSSASAISCSGVNWLM